jgi:hypothetical protein
MILAQGAVREMNVGRESFMIVGVDDDIHG